MEMRATRVYQRGRSRPARALRPEWKKNCESVSKRPFPTSQSRSGMNYTHNGECIKEAVPDQPEHFRHARICPGRVYQRGRSRPARARLLGQGRAAGSVSKRPFPTSQSASASARMTAASVSKRPFPTSQSRKRHRAQKRPECIKEAVPDQPELSPLDSRRPPGVYQRGRSRPARAFQRADQMLM